MVSTRGAGGVPRPLFIIRDVGADELPVDSAPVAFVGGILGHGVDHLDIIISGTEFGQLFLESGALGRFAGVQQGV